MLATAPLASYRTCPDCDGEGGYWVLDTARIRYTTVTPPEKWERCELCGGEGEIELDARELADLAGGAA